MIEISFGTLEDLLVVLSSFGMQLFFGLFEDILRF